MQYEFWNMNHKIWNMKHANLDNMLYATGVWDMKYEMKYIYEYEIWYMLYEEIYMNIK